MAAVWHGVGIDGKRRRRLTVFGSLECECKLILLSLGAKSVHNETPSRVPYLQFHSFVIDSLCTGYHHTGQSVEHRLVGAISVVKQTSKGQNVLSHNSLRPESQLSFHTSAVANSVITLSETSIFNPAMSSLLARFKPTQSLNRSQILKFGRQERKCQNRQIPLQQYQVSKNSVLNLHNHTEMQRTLTFASNLPSP